ncbi:HupE/UreJ family protein [Luteolibacter pohnpeiensis]|uniref:HupE/UreJ family protein n=1 Tax=Luteolibacter pohnpeiensis TaxID=454153 RepID=A0A934S3V0_9BACT|nr:HupE/UreJ family protein [Luteolibacter pohnpeiensis]MBK1881996.1 HupE/UreJ family protein [Luteolibacter pohnpeiensis]
MRTLRLVFGALLILTVSLQAHVVSQLYGEWVPQKEGSWEMRIQFEAGYAAPEIRDDPKAMAPSRSWLVGLGEARWSEMRKEAERYLRESLEIRSAGQKVDWQVSFPDFEKSPPDFPILLNDGAYFMTVIRPTRMPEGSVELTWNKGTQPTLILDFPGDEDDYLTLDPGDTKVIHIDQPQKTEKRGALLTSFLQGYHHVIPEGWDHVLFVLGLFFYRRKLRPLLGQSLAFTAAHTVTLGLAAAGIVKISGNWVEPAIAVSIVAVALENVFRGREDGPEKKVRLLVVFGFGLIHGLGFAGALSTWLKPGQGFLPSLLLANLGVEAAQATLLITAWILTIRWWKSKAYHYARIGICIGISLIGCYWTLQRVGLIP